MTTGTDLQSLIDRARRDPAAVRREAEQLLSYHREEATRPDPAVFEALGWACYELNELHAANAAAEAGIEEAGTRVPAPPVVGLAVLSGAVHAALGTPEVAEGRLRSLIRGADSAAQTQLWYALGSILGQAGHYGEALETLNTGLQGAHDQASTPMEVSILNNRAVLHMEQGEFELANVDLDRANELARAAGGHLFEAIVEHNRGVVHARRGNLPEALRLFRAAEETPEYASNNKIVAPALIDEALLLLDAGLIDEGLRAIRRAIALYDAAGAHLPAADAVLIEARLLAAHDDWGSSAKCAANAAKRASDAELLDLRRLAESQRDAYEIIGALAAGNTTENQLTPATLESLADQPDLAVDAGLLYGRNGDKDLAIRCLQLPERGNATNSALIDLHQAVARAETDRLVQWTDTSLRTAEQALTGAVSQSVALGVTELRSVASRRVRQLRDIAVRAELARGNLEAVVHLLELQRAVVLQPEPRLTDHERSLVTQIRLVVAGLNESQLSAPAEARLLRRRAKLEKDLHQERRLAQQAIRLDLTQSSYRELPHPVIHLFEVAGEFLGVVKIAGQPPRRLAPVPADAARRAIRAVRLALSASASDTSRIDPAPVIAHFQRTFESLRAALSDLDQAIVIPEATIGDIPWAFLTPHPIAQARSASQWLQSNDNDAPQDGSKVHVAAVAGPNLTHAFEEAQTVAQRWKTSVLLAGDAASAETTSEAFAAVDLMHFATHGRFRGDSPLFSSVELTDGPLTFFDLLAAARMPRRLIFSACEVGRSAESSLALTSLLFERGCAGFIASTGPLSDRAALPLIETVHTGLASGASMAASLATAQQALLTLAPSVALVSALGAA